MIRSVIVRPIRPIVAAVVGGRMAGFSTESGIYGYLRPGAAFYYLRPDGTSYYRRP